MDSPNEHRPLPTNRVDNYMPVSKQRIFSFDGLQPGDHLVQHGLLYAHHYLVESVSSDGTKCEVFESWLKFFKKKDLMSEEVFNTGDWMYMLNYEPGACVDTDKAIKQASEWEGQWLLDSKCNRKRIISYLKTSEECKDDVNLSDLDDSYHLSPVSFEQAPAKPISITPVSIDDNGNNTIINPTLKIGDHIIYNISSEGHCISYRSGLITSVDEAESKVMIMTLKGSLKIDAQSVTGVVEEELPFRQLKNGNPHIVNYYSPSESHESVESLAEKAIERATTRFSRQDDDNRERFHAWNNNSHLFVTWCKTGKEDCLTDILKELQDRDKETTRKPVLFKQLINGYNDIEQGDHLVYKSQHYLVARVTETKKFDAYTVHHKKCVFQTGLTLKKDACKVEYCDFEFAMADPEESLECAEENVGSKKWKCSSRFVTEMKCKTNYFIDERCLIDEVRPSDDGNEAWPIVSRTRISPHVSIEPGDHIFIKRDGSENFHSAIVYRSIDKYRFLILPPLPEANSKHYEITDLSPEKFAGEAYRLNYAQSLPDGEVLMRARCKSGVRRQQEAQSTWDYVSWAKFGKAIECPDLSTLPEDDGFLTQNGNVHRCYEIIRSAEDIKIGDHIFVSNGPADITLYHKHMLVTERTELPTKFKVAYCLRTYITESEIDLANQIAYRVRYVEELPSNKAIERARSKVGGRNFRPLARLWFVTWAKTGQDSIEISLLPYHSYPESKSQLASFTQLNPGDYLVKRYKSWYYHHYLVLSVESPTQCTVCESRTRQIRTVELKWEDKTDIYYRINYRDGTCFKHTRSIEHAESLFGALDLNIVSLLSRQKFVHLLKTGESVPVDVDELKDNNFFTLDLERVTSTRDLKRGDHIIRPIGKKLLRKVMGATHHMLVESYVDSQEGSVKVCHYKVSSGGFQKGTVTSEDMSIHEGEYYRMPYPDRIDPMEAIEALKDPKQRESYNVVFYNCEHLLTGVITGVAYSSQVESVASKLLKFSRTSLRNHVSKCASHGPRDIAIHSGTHHGVTAKILIRLPLVKSAILTGGITLAINLLLEIPLLARHIYKIHRRRKFNDISAVEEKRYIIREIFECIFILLGSMGGAVLGQILIPVPILGGVVGGIGGVMIGQILGYFVGWLAGKLVRPKKPVSLPTVLHKKRLPI